jgi:hypothetical protein
MRLGVTNGRFHSAELPKGCLCNYLPDAYAEDLKVSDVF